jgi:hypothetical protein
LLKARGPPETSLSTALSISFAEMLWMRLDPKRADIRLRNFFRSGLICIRKAISRTALKKLRSNIVKFDGSELSLRARFNKLARRFLYASPSGKKPVSCDIFTHHLGQGHPNVGQLLDTRV